MIFFCVVIGVGFMKRVYNSSDKVSVVGVVSIGGDVKFSIES